MAISRILARHEHHLDVINHRFHISENCVFVEQT